MMRGLGGRRDPLGSAFIFSSVITIIHQAATWPSDNYQLHFETNSLDPKGDFKAVGRYACSPKTAAATDESTFLL